MVSSTTLFLFVFLAPRLQGVGGLELPMSKDDTIPSTTTKPNLSCTWWKWNTAVVDFVRLNGSC